MAKNPKMTNAAATLAADAVCGQLNSGYIRIYSGTQPATADTGLAGNTLLAELRWNATAFAGAVNGVAAANAITSDTNAAASNTATWFRALKSDGTTVVFDGSVGTATADLVLSTVAITAGGTVSCSSFTYTQSKG